ncbi:MAG: hypothetical protein FWE23_10005 [Chitinivibrionia bacterium]|nr:hypothetical protein [Chitinivibrionia bacterium]
MKTLIFAILFAFSALTIFSSCTFDPFNRGGGGGGGRDDLRYCRPETVGNIRLWDNTLGRYDMATIWSPVEGANSYNLYFSGRLWHNTSDTFSIFRGLNPSIRYSLEISAVNDCGESAERAFLSFCLRPSPFWNVFAEFSNGLPKISWDTTGITHSDIIRTFNIYRSQNATDFTLIGTTRELFFIDTTFSDYEVSIYSVSAYTYCIENERITHVNCSALNSAPNIISAQGESELSISISWNSVKGASQYRVLRSEHIEGPYRDFSTTRDTSFWSFGSTAYYKIIAENACTLKESEAVFIRTLPRGHNSFL